MSADAFVARASRWRVAPLVIDAARSFAPPELLQG